MRDNKTRRLRKMSFSAKFFLGFQGTHYFTRFVFAFVALLTGLSLVLGGCSSGPAGGSKTLSIVIDCEENRKDEAEAVAAQLRQLGIQAEARTWEWSAMKEQFLQGNRQMYMTDWGSAYFDPFDLVIPKLKTGERGNYSFYSNSELDEILDQAVSTVDDEARKDLYYKAQEILYKDAPWVFGYYLKEIGAASNKVQNWKVSMDSRINLHDVSVQGEDTIVVALGVDKIVTLDPGNYRDRDTETVIRNMFDALVTRTPEGNVVPEVAESWETPDPKTYIFKLREGVKFHDGHILDADDVVFTFERVLKENGISGKTSPRKGLLGPLEKVEKVDARTVKFTLTNAFSVFPQALCHFQIVPKHYVEKVGDEEFAERPIGAGPFKFKEGRLDEEIVMERFDEYYGGSPDLPPVGKAQVQTVIFRMMPDPTTRAAALKAGEVHIIDKVPPSIAKELEKDDRLQVQRVPGTRVYAIEMCLTKPPFDDVRVRQALNYAINWDEILKTIYEGNGERLATAFLPSGFGFNKDLKPYEYDPNKAVELLKAAGFKVSAPKSK